jgi:hypothetical protein
MIKHLKTSPYHPATNGMVERVHGMINHGISALCRSRVNRWDEHLDEVVFGIRVRTHSVTKFSPFYLLFGTQPRLPGDTESPSQLRVPLDAVEAQIQRDEFTARELQELGQARGSAFLRSKTQYDQLNSNEKDFYFKVDDWVKMKDFTKTKFKFTWKGPYIIQGFGYFPTYWLRKPNGEMVKNLVSQNNLAPWISRLQDNEEYFANIDAELNEDINGSDQAFSEEEDNVGSGPQS